MPENKYTKEDKQFAIDSVIKIGLVLWGVNRLSKFLEHPFSEPGRTDRLPFDIQKTQQREIFYNPDEPPYIISDPWTPVDIALKAHNIFRNLTVNNEKHIAIYDDISNLGRDRARWLHNYWLDQIDASTTLFRWIETEWLGIYPGVVPGYDPEEVRAKEAVMKNLGRWGAGF